MKKSIKKKKEIKERKPLPKDQSCLLGMLVIVLIYLAITLPIHYALPNFTWYWFAFGLYAILVPCSIVYVKVHAEQQNRYTEEQIKNANARFGKYILFNWLIDCAYMAIFNKWSVWIYILGGIVLLITFYNLAKAFVNRTSRETFDNVVLILDFLVGVALTIYLIFIIPNETLQTVVTAIVAAIYGGLLTLVGVAWTIRNGDKARAEDLRRVEAERTEQERKKYIPYLKVTKHDTTQIAAQASIFRDIDFNNEEEMAQLQDRPFVVVNIDSFKIKNISDANILLMGINLDNQFYAFNKTFLLERNEVCVITTTGLSFIQTLNLFSKMFIVLNDILGNTYQCECQMRFKAGDATFCHEVNEKKYYGQQYHCQIEAIELPKLC